MGLFSLEPESSPEWGAESDLLETGFDPFRPPENDPDEPELLVAAAGPRVRNGETGEPRSSSRKSGLLNPMTSETGFPEECDIVNLIFSGNKQKVRVRASGVES